MSGYDYWKDIIVFDTKACSAFEALIRKMAKVTENGKRIFANLGHLYDATIPYFYEYNGRRTEDGQKEKRVSVDTNRLSYSATCNEWLKSIGNGAKIYITGFLAWLSDNYEWEAREFYRENTNLKFRPYKNSKSDFVSSIFVGKSEALEFSIESENKLTLTSARQSSHFLHFSNRAIKVYGRDEEQKLLREFVADKTNGLRWLQLAGVGGQGKSRLANELILSLDGSWEKGFLREKNLKGFDDKWMEWRPDKPHLIVFDYVIGSEFNIGLAMQAMAERSRDYAYPVRVLLIERQRWDRSGLRTDPVVKNNESRIINKIVEVKGRASWFDRLHIYKDEEDLDDSEIRYRDGIIELKSLNESDLIKIVREIGGNEISEELYSNDYIVKALRKIDKSGRPLYAYLLAQAISTGAHNGGWDKVDLLSYVLERNYKKRWTYQFADRPPQIGDNHPALRLALLATIIGYVEFSDVEEYMIAASPSKNVLEQSQILTDSPMGSGFNNSSNIVLGIEPDILGEWFFVRLFQESKFMRTILLAAYEMNPEAYFAFYFRVSMDFPEYDINDLFLRPIYDSDPYINRISLSYSSLNIKKYSSNIWSLLG